eukprot:g493.t1
MAHACAIVDPFLHVGSDRHRTRACQLRTISFDLDGEIKSWSISVPFLDWDCIIRGGHEDARVFDIFYMVLAGCPEEELQEMGIDLDRNPSQFQYLARTAGDPGTARGRANSAADNEKQYLKDYECFWDAVSALDLRKEIHEVLKLVAAVLHLGNVKYKWNGELKTVNVDKSQVELIKTISRLLDLNPVDLLRLICETGDKIGTRSKIKKVDMQLASEVRNAFAVEVYHRAVCILLASINRVGTPQTERSHNRTEEVANLWMTHGFPDRSIILIDPPSTPENEGLSGLYTNTFLEKMHQSRFQRIQAQMRFWETEGLNLKLSKFWKNDNKICVRMLDKIFSTLQSATNACKHDPSGSVRSQVAAALTKMYDYASQTRSNARRRASSHHKESCVEHFGKRTVAYAWQKIVAEHSIQSLTEGVAVTTLKLSKNAKLSRVSSTISSNFKECNRLFEFLSETPGGVIEILCLKSNAQEVAMALDTAYILSQLQLYGAAFLIRCAKLSFAHHYSCEDFYHMFCGLRAELATMHQAKSMSKGDRLEYMSQIVQGCKSLVPVLASNGVNSEHIRVGKTRVFVRTDETMQHLLRIATQLKKSSATKIQAIVRMFLARNLLFHQAMVWCHLDPAVDWQRELMLMREEDVRSALESKAFALALWNSEEEVTKRRWNEDRNASINRELLSYHEAGRKNSEKYVYFDGILALGSYAVAELFKPLDELSTRLSTFLAQSYLLPVAICVVTNIVTVLFCQKRILFVNMFLEAIITRINYQQLSLLLTEPNGFSNRWLVLIQLVCMLLLELGEWHLDSNVFDSFPLWTLSGVIGLVGFFVCKLLDEEDEWKLLHAETVRVRNAVNQDKVVNAVQGGCEIVKSLLIKGEQERQGIQKNVGEAKEMVDSWNNSWFMTYFVYSTTRQTGKNIGNTLAHVSTRIEDSSGSVDNARDGATNAVSVENVARYQKFIEDGHIHDTNLSNCVLLLVENKYEIGKYLAVATFVILFHLGLPWKIWDAEEVKKAIPRLGMCEELAKGGDEVLTIMTGCCALVLSLLVSLMETGKDIVQNRILVIALFGSGIWLGIYHPKSINTCWKQAKTKMESRMSTLTTYKSTALEKKFTLILKEYIVNRCKLRGCFFRFNMMNLSDVETTEFCRAIALLLSRKPECPSTNQKQQKRFDCAKDAMEQMEAMENTGSELQLLKLRKLVFANLKVISVDLRDILKNDASRKSCDRLTYVEVQNFQRQADCADEIIRGFVSEVCADTGYTPVVSVGEPLAPSSACEKGDVEAVPGALAASGVDVNEKGGGGRTPLFKACRDGHLEVVRALLGRLEVVRALLGADGIQANQARTDDGCTPLYI